MNKLLSAGLIAAGLAASVQTVQASNRYADYARVIASEPVYEYVSQPQRECWNEQIGHETARDRSYAGAIIGGIAGGILGNQVGKGSGKSVATAVGAATGVIVGDSIDNDGVQRTSSRPVYAERCRTIEHSNRHLTGYDVTYRYQDRVYTTFMQRPPGKRIRVKVSVEPEYD